MVQYKIIHDRENCIGCDSCAKMDRLKWKMNLDAKSDLINANEVETGTFVKEFDSGFELSLEVAQSCPVNVIHIEKNDKKII